MNNTEFFGGCAFIGIFVAIALTLGASLPITILVGSLGALLAAVQGT